MAVLSLQTAACGRGGSDQGGGNNAALVSGPQIQSLPPTAAIAGKTVEYQVDVASASPGSIILSLNAAPQGMTINNTTRVVRWTPTSNQVGDHLVEIVVTDAQGRSSQSFTLSVFGSHVVTSAQISQAGGGVITVNDANSNINGLSINIPPGALPQDLIIAVSELELSPTLGGASRFLMKGFTIEPEVTQLSLPVKITMPYSANEFASNAGVPNENFLGAYFMDDQTGILEFLDSFSVNPSQHTIVGSLLHFSTYIISNTARLQSPLTLSTSTINLPAILVHGFQWTGMGEEGTWGQLRTLLAQSSTKPPVDAWRFDWDSRYVSYEVSANHLAIAIGIVRGQSGAQSVNLVAHSFGGILVRTYIQGLAKQLAYQGDVNRAMTLGTPHRGIGGDFSIDLADYCAFRATHDYKYSPTCAQTATGVGGGTFLHQLNNQLPTALLSSVTPQYYIIIGRTLDVSKSGINLTDNDGLITSAGANICAGSAALASFCASPSVKIESLPANTVGVGLCHSSILLRLDCGLAGNKPMAEINDTNHPLWHTIQDFLSSPVLLDGTITEVSCKITIIPDNPVKFRVTVRGTGRNPDASGIIRSLYSRGVRFDTWPFAAGVSPNTVTSAWDNIALGSNLFQIARTGSNPEFTVWSFQTDVVVVPSGESVPSLARATLVIDDPYSEPPVQKQLSGACTQ